jgi:hypothetical protein
LAKLVNLLEKQAVWKQLSEQNVSQFNQTFGNHTQLAMIEELNIDVINGRG